LSDSLDDILFIFFKNIFNLGEVGFDDIGHSAEVLEQGGNFLLKGYTEDSRDFRLHRPYDALDFLLVIGILCYEGALEFHNSLNDDLELINFGFLLIWKDVAVFKDLSDYLVELCEGVRKYAFNLRDLHDARLLKILKASDRSLMGFEILFQ
jgi:hypothetical protein